MAVRAQQTSQADSTATGSKSTAAMRAEHDCASVAVAAVSGDRDAAHPRWRAKLVVLKGRTSQSGDGG